MVEVGDLLGHGLEADPAGRLGAVPLPLESVQVPLASADEDESGDSGAGGHEHGDLAHGVPGADVDEGDVDDVLAVADLVGELAEVRRDRIGHAHARGDEDHEHHRDPHGSADDRPPGRGEAAGGLADAGRQAAEDEDEDDDRDGLDQHLCQGQIGGADEGEVGDHGIAGDAGDDDGGEALLRPGRRDRDDDEDGGDDEVERGVGQSELDVPGVVDDHGQPDPGDQDEVDHALVEGQGTALGAGGDPQGQRFHPADHLPVQLVEVDSRRQGRLHPGERSTEDEERDTGDDRHGRERQRRFESVPQRQVVVAVPDIHGRQRGGPSGEVAVEESGPRAQGQGEHGEEQRGDHERELLVAAGDVVDAGLRGEGAPDEAGRVGDGEDRTDHDADEGDDRGLVRRRQQGRVHGFLRDEAEHRGQSRHRGGRDRRAHGHDGECLPTAGELRQVAGAGAVVDDAHAQEQAGLEQGVGDEQAQRRFRDVGGAEGGHGGEEAQLGDRAEGQQQFEVGLLQGLPAADEHGQQAQRQQHLRPAGKVVVARRQTQHQVDSGLDHGRGVKVGTDGGGGGHRARQPEVEGHERGLRDRADEDEDDRGDDDRTGVHAQLGAVDQRRDASGARGGDEQDHAHEHGQAAGGGDDQRLQSRLAGAAS